MGAGSYQKHNIGEPRQERITEMTGKDRDRRDDNKNNTGWGAGLQSLTLVTQLGLTIAIPIVLGAMAGHWLDVKFGTGMILSIILIFLGIAGGIAGAWHLITAVVKWKK